MRSLQQAISFFSAPLFALMISYSAHATECETGYEPGCYAATGDASVAEAMSRARSGGADADGMVCVAKGNDSCYERVPVPTERPENPQKPPRDNKQESEDPKDKETQEAGGGDQTSEMEAVQAKVEACESAAQTAAADCSANKNNSTTQQALADINSAASAMNGSKSAQACRNLNSAISSANATMSSLKQTCQNSYDYCATACNMQTPSDRTLASRLQTATSTCMQGSQLVASINQNMAKVQTTQSQGTSCQADATDSSDNSGLLSLAQAAMSMMTAQDCTKNPASCGMTVPQFPQTALPVTPPSVPSVTTTSPYNGGGTDNPDYATGSGGLSDSSFGGLGAGSDQFNFNDPSHRNPGGAGSGSLPAPPSGSVAGNSGQGANKPGPPQKPGRPGSSISTNILGGARGGGPGSAFAAAVSKNPGAGSVTKGGSWIPPKVPDDPRNINLDRFRPGIQGYRMPTGLAKTTSELLASHVDIWKQVNMRYLSLMITLKP